MGEHTREVLAEYGFSGEHIERLIAEDRQVSCAGAEAIHRARSSLNTTAMVFAMICRSSRSDQFRR